MSRQEILNEIDKERDYQDKNWGHEADDTKNKPNDWVSYIGHYATKWFPRGHAPYNAETVEKFRTSMLKAAAIAVAAVESIDRQREQNGKPFYQE